MTQHETFEDFADQEYADQVLIRDHTGELWLAFETEWGDWLAVRSRGEGDVEVAEPDRWRPVGPDSVEGLAFPIEAVEVERLRRLVDEDSDRLQEPHPEVERLRATVARVEALADEPSYVDAWNEEAITAHDLRAALRGEQ